MSQIRLYLVRREGREFIGPMKLPEFQERLARLEFGMQDEVSGHCGPWIEMDRKDEIIRHYPEIAKTLGEDLPLSWREATGHAKVISRKDSRRDKKDQFAEHKKSRTDFHRYIEMKKQQSNARKIYAIAILAAAMLIGALIITRKDDSPNVSEVASLALRADPGEFLNIMGMKVIPQASRIGKSSKLQAVWVPYLRMYAFFTTGTIDGIPQKVLRGDAPSVAPSECSVEFWKRKWRETSSQTIAFIQGKSLQKNPWTKLLASDPDWIRRRPSKGWLKPRNYFEGCLMTAHTAIRSLAGELATTGESSDVLPAEIADSIAKRLMGQLEAISLGRAGAMPVRGDLLSAFSCLETQENFAALSACRAAFDSQIKPLQEEKFALALLRLAILQGQMDKGLLVALQAQSPKITGEDIMNHFDMTAESKLATYIAQSGSVEQAMTQIEGEYPDLKFR